MRYTGVSTGYAMKIALLVSLLTALPGCGGTKILKEPQPLELTNELASTANEQISVTLDWVIVRDGPGTWAKNADWDEYLLTVVNQSESEIQILDVAVVDSLETRLASSSRRKLLVKESKKTAKRYKGSNLKVKAGFGAGTMFATGAGIAVVGTAAAYGAATAALASGTATAGGAAIATSGVVLLAPVLIVGGIVRASNNSRVSQEIEARHTELPLTVLSGNTSSLVLFFPLAPSPRQVEITYAGRNGAQTLIVDTSEALQGLHLVPKKGQAPDAQRSDD